MKRATRFVFVGAFASGTLLALPAQAFDTSFNYGHSGYGCAPRAQRELYTPALSDTTTQPRPQAPTKLDVSFYGDSRITSKCYYTPAGGGAKEYSTHAQTLAAKAVQGLGKTFAQRGRDGTSLRELQAGADAVVPGAPSDANDTVANKDWATMMNRSLGDNADIVVIAHGTNDAWKDIQANRSNGASEFEGRLSAMVDVALNNGHKVLLVQPFRACSFAMVDSAGAWNFRESTVVNGSSRSAMRHPDSILAPYAAAVSRVGLAKGVHVAPLFSVPTRCSGDYALTDMPDGLHATSSFNDKLAAVIKEGLARVINNVPLNAVKPTFTLLRAPYQQMTNSERQYVAGTTTYPTIMPAAGQDYQMLVGGLGRDGLPAIQLSNWVGAYAQSVSVSCSIQALMQTPTSVSWSNLAEINVGAPGAMPDPATWSCTWTASGPGGSATVPEQFVVHPANNNISAPRVTVARSPMPLVAGNVFLTTWRAENATSLYRWCTASGTGMKDAGWTQVPLSSDPNFNVGPKVSNFALLNPVVTIQAESAWVGNPSSCQWAAVGNGVINYFTEYVNTVAP